MSKMEAISYLIAETIVKVAHMRLCHSRMPFVRAYPRESQEMVFDAHDRAFAFFKGACTRGIYDNLWTPPGQDKLLAAGGMECVNLSGLSLERSRSWP